MSSIRLPQPRELLFGIACVVAATSVANAELGGEPARESGWMPSFRISPGIHIQGLDGNTVSQDALPALRVPVPDDPATAPREDQYATPGAPGDSATLIAFRFGLRLYAPEALLSLPDRARPRLFIEAGAEVPLDDQFVAARYNFDFDRGDGTVADFCPGATQSDSCSYAARVNVDLLANWNVGIGADFTLPIWERQYHLVPYVGYFGQAYEADGRFGLKLNVPGQSDVTNSIKAESGTEIVHGVSAGLGLEIDVYDGPRVDSRLFLESRMSWILTDRETNFSGTNPTPTPNFDTADFLARVSGFVVTLAAGFEFRFVGL